MWKRESLMLMISETTRPIVMRAFLNYEYIAEQGFTLFTYFRFYKLIINNRVINF